MGSGHRPVMLAEVLKALQPSSGGLYVDGTLGAGGHAQAILEASAPDGRLLGLDRDASALAEASRRLEPYGRRVRLVLSTFDRAARELAVWAQGLADGVLLDLGVSSMQLDRRGRGFSFRRDEPLDMRMGAGEETAAQLLADLTEKELARLFARLGEEKFSKRIAAALVSARSQAPIATTGQLARLVSDALPAAERRKRKLNPATKVFQALRMSVNDELGQLERFLESALSMLAPGGRLAVLAYHSLEDRMVKRAFSAWANPCTCPPDLPMCACGKKPLVRPVFSGAQKPGAAEVAENPRARSARLRAVERTEVAL